MGYELKKVKIIFCFLFVILVFDVPCYSQDTLKYKPVTPNKAYFISYLQDTRDLIISPFHWNGSQWIGAASVTAVSGVVLLTEDKNIKYFAQNYTSPLANGISKYGLEPWGSGVYSISAMALLYMGGLAWKNEKAEETALLATKSFILCGGGVEVAKYIFHRERPYMTDNPKIFLGPSFSNSGAVSFPSGHTTVAFGVATVIASEYKDKPAIPIIAYTIAGLVGLSRIYDNKHWASDVFFSAPLGWAVGKLVAKGKNWHGRKRVGF